MNLYHSWAVEVIPLPRYAPQSVRMDERPSIHKVGLTLYEGGVKSW